MPPHKERSDYGVELSESERILAMEQSIIWRLQKRNTDFLAI